MGLLRQGRFSLPVSIYYIGFRLLIGGDVFEYKDTMQWSCVFVYNYIFLYEIKAITHKDTENVSVYAYICDIL